LQPLIKTIKGLNIALFSLDTTQPRFAATDTEPGIAYFDPQNLDYIKKDFSKLLQQTHQQAHVVLVALHYGANNKLRPTAQDRAVAHALIDAGADAVLGASAHRLQGIEIYKGRPIIH